MQKRYYISIPLLFLAFGLCAQTENPFDLKWRSGNSAPAEILTEANDTHLVELPIAVTPEDAAPSGMHEMASIDSVTTGSAEISSDNLVSHDSVLDASESKDAISNKSTPDSFSLSDVNNGESDVADREIENDKITSALATDNINVIPLDKQTPPPGKIGMALFLILFGLALIVLTWAVNINRGFLQKIYKAALNENFSALLLREQRFASSQYLYYIVYAVFFLNGGLFLYLTSRYATWDFGHRNTPIFLFLVFLALVYASKHAVTRLLGETFQISKEMRHYNFNIILYNILAGIALMPVNLLLAFGPAGIGMPMIYTGLGIIVLMYLMRQFRGIIIGLHLIVKDVFQFFVYLCAIEILPVLVLFKYFPN
jgi:uncharacterized protein DUF4271